MSFLPNIFTRNQPQAQQQPAAGGQNQNQQQGNTGNTATTMAPPNGMQQQPGNTATTSDPNQGQMSSLDTLMKLMTPTQQQGNQNQPQEFSVFGKVDPKQLDQHISGANFANNLDPELMQKAMSGDQQSMTQLLNSVAQNVFRASLQFSQQAVEMGVKRGNEHMTGNLDSHFRQYELRNQNISTDNPALKHPVGKAMVSSFAQQIANANPGMSPQEVQRQAEQGVLDFMKIGGTAQMQPDNSSNPAGKKDTNWLEYLN